MSLRRFIILLAIICFNFSQLFSQTEVTSLIKPFGIGIHIEQFKLNDLTDLRAPANKIIFSISPSNLFRFEPEFGFKMGEDKNIDAKYSGFYMGLGALGMFQRNKLNLYGGLRFEYAFIKEKRTYTAINFIETTSTETTNRFIIGPAIGCEYYLGDNFSFGGEFALKYGSLKTVEDPEPVDYKDEKSYYITTDSGLFIRFYL